MMQDRQRIVGVDLGADQYRFGVLVEKQFLMILGDGRQFGNMDFHEIRRHPARLEVRMPEQVLQEPNVGRDTGDLEFTERPIGFSHHVGDIGAVGVGDHFGQQ